MARTVTVLVWPGTSGTPEAVQKGMPVAIPLAPEPVSHSTRSGTPVTMPERFALWLVMTAVPWGAGVTIFTTISLAGMAWRAVRSLPPMTPGSMVPPPRSGTTTMALSEVPASVATIDVSEPRSPPVLPPELEPQPAATAAPKTRTRRCEAEVFMRETLGQKPGRAESLAVEDACQSPRGRYGRRRARGTQGAVPAARAHRMGGGSEAAGGIAARSATARPGRISQPSRRASRRR